MTICIDSAQVTMRQYNTPDHSNNITFLLYDKSNTPKSEIIPQAESTLNKRNPRDLSLFQSKKAINSHENVRGKIIHVIGLST